MAVGIYNEQGKAVDLYIPRKCAITNRLIGPKDHASVQITINHLNENGVICSEKSSFCISGEPRLSGSSDSKFTELAVKAGIIAN